MKISFVFVLTLAAFTLVWAAGDLSFAQDNKPRDPQENRQQEQQQPPQQPPPVEQKQPTKPLPPEFLNEGGMSGVGRPQTYPNLPSTVRTR